MSREEIKNLSVEDKQFFIGKYTNKVAYLTIVMRKAYSKMANRKKWVERIGLTLLMLISALCIMVIGLRPDLAIHTVMTTLGSVVVIVLIMSVVESRATKKYRRAYYRRQEAVDQLNLFDEE
mgnify:CR=1 FL=1